MAITDRLVDFLPPGSNLAVLGAAVATNVYDILGLGVGVTPAQGNVIIGKPTLFGADMGVGIVRPKLLSAVGTSFAGGTNITAAFQGAIDDGTGNPSTWTTFLQSPAMLTAQLTAGTFMTRWDWPPEFPDGFNPRFCRVLFTPSGTFNAGTIAYCIVSMGPWQNMAKYAGNNFTVAP